MDGKAVKQKVRPLIRASDQRMIVAELEAAIQRGIKWAILVYEDNNGDSQLVSTNAPSRYSMIGVLEDMKHDLLQGENTE